VQQACCTLSVQRELQVLALPLLLGSRQSSLVLANFRSEAREFACALIASLRRALSARMLSMAVGEFEGGSS
jgi:hypothetical protein